ncbi:MAG: hypothetical protein GXY05_12120 [Clostridiales bacterium]|nr:hypothetical protein [Clostridiales bacterium]
MKRKNSFIAGLMFVLSMAVAGAGMAQSRESAEELIRRDWELFENFSRQDYSDRVAETFAPDKQLFLNELENAFRLNIPVDLTFSVDEALAGDRELAITITWQRRTADRDTGELSLSEGKCTVVYIRENNDWLIYSIQGSSLFAA